MEPKQEIATVPQQEHSGFMTILNSREALKDLEIDKIERLLAAQQQWENHRNKHEAEIAFSEAFSELQGNMPTVRKSLYNDQTRSRYADIATIIQAVTPSLRAHGFSVRFKTSQTKEDVTAICVLRHIRGHVEETPVTMPLDLTGAKGTVNKTTIHATKSAFSYAARTALCLALNIAMKDDDGNAAGDATVTEMQQDTIRTLAMKADPEKRDKILTRYQGEIANIPVPDFSLVCAQLKQAELKGAANASA